MRSSPAHLASSAQPITCSGCHRWTSGPITTVRHEHMPAKASAVTRVGFAAWKWFSESGRRGTVVLGNHPYSVRLQKSSCPPSCRTSEFLGQQSTSLPQSYSMKAAKQHCKRHRELSCLAWASITSAFTLRFQCSGYANRCPKKR